MRNITFDESTVLGEFARIMNEKEIVKTADDAAPGTIEFAGTTYPPQQSASEISFGKPIRPTKEVLALVGDKPSDMNEIKRRFQGYLNSVLQNTQKSKQVPPTFQADYAAKIKSVIDYLNKVFVSQAPDQAQEKTYQQELQRLVGELNIMFTNIMRHIQVATKTAAKQETGLYDVSGETGEQLIDSAHPGNTTTEVSMKTKENVIETIVEQQERDLAVVKKMPKGTYAALVDLADRLDKRGFNDAANRVDEIIRIALPPGSARYVPEQPEGFGFGAGGGEMGPTKLPSVSPGFETKIYSRTDYADRVIRQVASQIRNRFNPTEHRKQVDMFVKTNIEVWLGRLSDNKELYARLNELPNYLNTSNMPPTIVPGIQSILYDAISLLGGTQGFKMSPLGNKGRQEVGISAKQPVVSPTAPTKSNSKYGPQARVNWIRLYNKISGVTQVPEASAINNNHPSYGDKAYMAAIKAVKDSGAGTLAEYAQKLSERRNFESPNEVSRAPSAESQRAYTAVLKYVASAFGLDPNNIKNQIKQQISTEVGTLLDAGHSYEAVVAATKGRIIRILEQTGQKRLR